MPAPRMPVTEPLAETETAPRPLADAWIPSFPPVTAPPNAAAAVPLPPKITAAVPNLPTMPPVVLTLAPPLPSAVATIACRRPLTSTAET